MTKAYKRKDSGVPETIWHCGNMWQITTWETIEIAWAVRVDGPEGRFWEAYGFDSRDDACEEGIVIIEGFQHHDG